MIISSSQRSRAFTLAVCTTVFLGTSSVRAQVTARVVQNPLTAEELAPLVGGPTLVTLQGEDIPLGTAVKTLMDAAQLPFNHVLLKDDAARRVTVHWQNTPFLEAARDLEQKTGFRWIRPSNPVAAILLGIPLQFANIVPAIAGQDSLGGTSSVNTPLVRIVASAPPPPARQYEDNFVQNEGVNGAKSDNPEKPIQLTVYFDPHIRLTSNVVTARITSREVEDDTFRTFTSAPTSRVADDSVMVRNFMRIFNTVVETEPGQRKVLLITGSLQTEVVTKSEIWEVPNITQNTTATREVNGVTYQLNSVALTGDHLLVKTSTHGSRSPGNLPIRVLDGRGWSW